MALASSDVPPPGAFLLLLTAARSMPNDAMPTDTAIPEFVLESVGSLPPLPRAARQLINLTRDEQADFKQITSVIETDQTLTARTLRAANSALYGSSRRISTVSQAIVRLGQETLTNLALSISVMHLQQDMAQSWPLNSDAYWRHNLAVATAARMLAKELRLPSADEAFVAGLLHDIGKLVMVQHFGVVYQQVMMAAQHGTEPLHLLEREVLEVDHTVVGHALCLHWNIPAAVTRAVAEHHDEELLAPNSIAEVVRDANDLAKIVDLGASGNAYAELRPEQHLSLCRLRPNVLSDLLQRLPGEVDRTYNMMSGGGSQASSAGRSVGDEKQPPAIHLQVSIPEERRMLIYLITRLGLRPVVLQSGVAVPDDAALPVALLTDLPMSDESDAAAARDIPVLDFACWRSRNGQPSGRYFNVQLLSDWLRESVPGVPASGRGQRRTSSAAAAAA